MAGFWKGLLMPAPSIFLIIIHLLHSLSSIAPTKGLMWMFGWLLTQATQESWHWQCNVSKHNRSDAEAAFLNTLCTNLSVTSMLQKHRYISITLKELCLVEKVPAGKSHFRKAPGEILVHKKPGRSWCIKSLLQILVGMCWLWSPLQANATSQCFNKNIAILDFIATFLWQRITLINKVKMHILQDTKVNINKPDLFLSTDAW